MKIRKINTQYGFVSQKLNNGLMETPLAPSPIGEGWAKAIKDISINLLTANAYE